MKQQFVVGLIVIFFAINSLSCSANYDFNEEKMKTLGGETILLKERADTVYSEEFGFGFVLPEMMLDMVKRGALEIYPLSSSVTMLVAYSDGIFDLITAFDSGSSTPQEQEAIRAQVGKYVLQLAVVARAGIDMDQTTAKAELEASYNNVQEIAKTDENIYYFGYNDDYSHLILESGEAEKFEGLIDTVKTFKKNVFVFNPVRPESAQVQPSAEYNLSSFEAETLDGGTVDQSIFADYDITMVNVWATWCGPCINEMPDLAELHREMLPENANMITILTDVPDGIETAKDIVSTSNGSFTTLFANDSLNGLLNTVTAIPTTVMVDSKGNIIGSPIVGAPPTNPAERYLDAIESALETIGK